MTKYLLCRPKGGWTDTLVVIGLCYEYAKKFNRKLIVDTQWVSGIRDDLSYYFDKRDNCDDFELFLSEDYKSLFKDLDFYPKFSTPHIPEFPPSINTQELEGPFYLQDKEKIIFDLRENYKEEVLVYQHWRTTGDPFNFLSRLKVNYNLASEIRSALNNIAYLSKSFRSVMIRNTDYRTKYEPYYKTIQAELGHDELLVIASDDRGCIAFAENFFSNPVISFSMPPNSNIGSPLIAVSAYDQNSLQRIYNWTALKDLFICASALKFYPTILNAHDYSGNFIGENRMSGFIDLTNKIFYNGDLRNTLING